MIELPGTRLTSAIRARLARAAEERYPDEACGLLFAPARSARIDEVTLVAAAGTRPDRFVIPAAAVIRETLAARRRGRRLEGVFHSHSDAAAMPSRVDLEGQWGDLVWAITPCHEGRAGPTRLWQLRPPRQSEPRR